MKAERQRIDAFEMWFWRRLLRVHWTARRSNQSIVKEISPEYSLGGPTVKFSETAILWPPDAKNWLIGKDPESRNDWRWEEKEMTEDEMVGWHHWLNGHEFEQAPGVGDGQGGLECCIPWGCKESDMTEWLNWIELNWWKDRVNGELYQTNWKQNLFLKKKIIRTVYLSFSSLTTLG